MRKAISLILAVILCLGLCACAAGDACTCDCAQCADCEKKTQIADVTHADNALAAADQNDNVIKFETPIVVAEDENLRVEAVKFYQDYRTFDVHGYPSNADASTEGATLEKYVVFNYCNKTDHALRIELNEIYLGSNSAFSVYARISDNVAAGKKFLREHIIQTGEKETVKSMEELYSLDGDFYVWHVGDDDVSRDRYRLKFSIPGGMNASSETPASETVSLANSPYLGKWEVAEIKFADENASSYIDQDREFWENYLEGMLSSFDNIYLILAESGDFYYHSSDENVNRGKWKTTETGVSFGSNVVYNAVDNQLIYELDGYLICWEKVSASQEFPET